MYQHPTASHPTDQSANPSGPRGLAAELGKQAAFTQLETEAALSLIRTTEALRQPFDQYFRSQGITSPLYNILRILRGHRMRADAAAASDEPPPKSLSVQQIAGEMLTREPDMTRLIDRLERRGLIRRRRSTTDRRVVRVEITDEGMDAVEAMIPECEGLHRAQFAHMPRERLQQLIDLLCEARRGAAAAAAARVTPGESARDDGPTAPSSRS